MYVIRKYYLSTDNSGCHNYIVIFHQMFTSKYSNPNDHIQMLFLLAYRELKLFTSPFT